jgi:MFS family permease
LSATVQPDVPDIIIEAPAPFSAWFAVAVLVGVTIFSFVDRQILAVVASPLRESLGLTDLQLGALQGLGLALFAAIATYPIAWLADRFDRRLILALGIAVWSAATAACAFQTTFEGLLVATIGIAVGEAGLGPIVWAVIPDLFPGRQRATANLVYFLAAILGTALGMSISGATFGWLAAHGAALPGFLGQMEPWRATMLFVALPGPLFIALVATLRLGGSRAAAIASAAAFSTRRAGSGFIAYAKRHFTTLACVFAAVAAYNIGIASTLVWLPTALPRILETDPATVSLQLGMAIGPASLVGVGISAVCVKFWRGDRSVMAPRIAAMAFLVAAAPTTLLPFVASIWQALGLIALQFAAGLAAASVLPSIIQDISPPHLRARNFGVMTVVALVPQGLSPLVIGGLSEMLGGSHGLISAIAIVGAPAWLLAAVLIWRSETVFRRTVAEVQSDSSALAAADLYPEAATPDDQGLHDEDLSPTRSPGKPA